MKNEITKINLDKKNWKIFRFEEISEKISETISPKISKSEIYVGLEHLNPNDIHIRRNGSPDQVKGNKLKFYPDDIIFGKRRAYQRKAAISNNHGICSAHAFVFRAYKDVIDPKLFPFFLHSDQFMDRMIDISVGGLSPTINWGDLKHQKFLIPPKDEQTYFTKLLWSLEDVIEKDIKTREILLLSKKCFLNDIINQNKELTNLDNLFEINWGDTNTTKKSYVDNGHTAYSAAGPDGFLSKYDFNTEGIVLAAIGTCGKCYFAEGKWSAIKNTITLIPKKINLNYMKIIYEIINDVSYWRSSGGVQKFISLEEAKKSKIFLLDKNKVKNYFKTLQLLNNALNEIEISILISKSLKKSLINQIF